MAFEDILSTMLARGWPFTKATYLAVMMEPDLPDFPLDGEVEARVPTWLPGAMPESVVELIFPADVQVDAGPLVVMRDLGWPWTKAAYVRALYHPEQPELDDRNLLEALAAWVPSNLRGDMPESAHDLAVTVGRSEEPRVAPADWWPTARAVSIAMNERDYGRDEAIVDIVAHESLAARVMAECQLNREDAIVAIVQADAIVEPLMSRHGMSRDDAVVELVRAWR